MTVPEVPGVISEGEVQTIVGWVSQKPEPYLSACAVIAGMAALLTECTTAKQAVDALHVIADEVGEREGVPVRRTTPDMH